VRLGPSLLERVQGLLERTYAMRSGVEDLGRFVIGDRGLRSLYADGARKLPSAGSADGSDARMLVRQTPYEVRAAVYYPDALIAALERFPPQAGLREENVQPFATLVEELDHLLLVAERTRGRRPVTLFELELHANISKHLVLARFLAGRRPCLGDDQRRWLRERLFDGVRYCDEDPEARARYREAARRAVRLLDGVSPLPPTERLRVLREFHAAGLADKLCLIEAL